MLSLKTPAQKTLFVLGCFGLCPWIVKRAIIEIWNSDGPKDYMNQVMVQPISPWFDSGWWWSTKLEWYDWPVLPSICLLALAFVWPYTGGNLLKWIKG
jgi:hypothetical protein